MSILLNFFSINKFVFDFSCLCLFCYNAGHHSISCQKHGIQHRVISSVCHVILMTLCCGRTDGRTDGHVTMMSLPKSLGFIGYQICLAMVLRWLASARAPLWLLGSNHLQFYAVNNRGLDDVIKKQLEKTTSSPSFCSGTVEQKDHASESWKSPAAWKRHEIYVAVWFRGLQIFSFVPREQIFANLNFRHREQIFPDFLQVPLWYFNLTYETSIQQQDMQYQLVYFTNNSKRRLTTLYSCGVFTTHWDLILRRLDRLRFYSTSTDIQSREWLFFAVPRCMRRCLATGSPDALSVEFI